MDFWNSRMNKTASHHLTVYVLFRQLKNNMLILSYAKLYILGFKWKFWCFANLIGENIPLQLLFSFFLLWMRLNIVLCLRDMNYCFFKCWCIYFIWYVEMLCVLGLLAICLQYEFASIFVWFLSVFDFACAYFARVILQSICQNCLLIFWCVFLR